MPTKYSVAESKRLGGSILKFLESHAKNRRLAPDQLEGISVAMQCLTLVFDAVPSDSKDCPDLMEVFNAECVVKGLVLPEAVVPTDEEKKAAVEFKDEGNKFMRSKDYEQSAQKYSLAIEKDPTSATYFCNRAAAYTNLEKYHEALDDCKKAINIDENYAKAFSRMALIYSKLQFFEESVSCYKTAIDLEPDNEGYKQNLEKVEVKAKEQQKVAAQQQMMGGAYDPAAMMGYAAGAQAGGMPPGAGGMPGQMPPEMIDAYSQFAQNPEFAKMADNIMANPDMKGMVDTFMKNAGVEPPAPGSVPGAGVNPMESLGAAMGNGANVEDLMKLGQQFAQHMQKENPEMIDNLRKQMEGMAPGSAPPNTEEPPK